MLMVDIVVPGLFDQSTETLTAGKTYYLEQLFSLNTDVIPQTFSVDYDNGTITYTFADIVFGVLNSDSPYGITPSRFGNSTLSFDQVDPADETAESVVNTGTHLYFEGAPPSPDLFSHNDEGSF